MILGWIYLDLPPVVLGSLAFLITIGVSFCCWIKNLEIALAFCKCRITVEDQSEENKIQIFQKDINEKRYLYRYSSDWFGSEKKIAEESLDSIEIPECIICTTEMAEMIWLPCGHMSLCSICSQDMVSNKMFSCVLCKQQPTEICKIATQKKFLTPLEK